MKLYLHQSGTWIVSFRTKHGCKRLNTKQTDRRLAELVVKEAKIEQIELARTINLVASAASMHALCGRVVTSRDAFKEWLDHLQASHPSGTVIRYERVVKLFLNRMHWPKMLSEIRSVSIDSWINSTESEAHAQTRNVH
ncbi:MAG TPA: hypothetical protein VNU68_29150, partial [Verrucomicrobiae bacterium]|nr:hypothetical protein [Verrucomicrobiae bacterium]